MSALCVRFRWNTEKRREGDVSVGDIKEDKSKNTEEKLPSEAFEEFRQIVEQLRGENGCPWDKAQTFESLRSCLVNETAETLAGIRLYEQTGEASNLCEELGDVLLQVVLLSQIAQENGLFTITDVIEGISRKMVRRHPNVFPKEGAASGTSALNTLNPAVWTAIKQEEKQEKGWTPEQEAREKQAVCEAKDWMLRHLTESGKQQGRK